MKSFWLLIICAFLGTSAFAQDVTSPTLVSTALSGNTVTFTFSEPMSTQFSLAWIANQFVDSTNIIPLAWSSDKLSATVQANLPPNTAIVFVLNPSDRAPALRDLAGNFIAQNTYSDDVANFSSVPPLFRPVWPTGIPSSLLVNLGTSVTLGYIVLGSKPRTLQWLRNGVPIPNATSQFLSLTSVSAADAGSYTLTVTNAFGSSASSPIAVSLIGAPAIQTQPQNQTVTNGANVTFQVSASGAAPLSYQWMFNGVRILDATNSVFTFSSAQIVNAGSYSVIVSNAAGSVLSTTAVLTLDAPPSITSAATATAYVGLSFNYTIFADNSPTSFGAVGLPAGLNLNGTTGLISGTPTTAGTFTINLSATNTRGAGTATLMLTVNAGSPGPVVAWGYNNTGQTTVPTGLSGVTAVAGGDGHTVALRNNGTVVAWGNNGNGETTIPVGLGGVTAVAAGGSHTVALRTNGQVVAWGSNNSGQTNVPVGLSGVTAIAGGGFHTVALKSDGTVVAWGGNNFGQTTVPAGLNEVTAIAAGYLHTVANGVSRLM